MATRHGVLVQFKDRVQMKITQPPRLGDVVRRTRDLRQLQWTRALRQPQSRPSLRANSVASEACQEMPLPVRFKLMLLLLADCWMMKARILNSKLLSVQASRRPRQNHKTRQLVPNAGRGRRSGGTEAAPMAREEALATASSFHKIGSALPRKLPADGLVLLQGMLNHQMFGLQFLYLKQLRQLYLQPPLGRLRRPLQRTCSIRRRRRRRIHCSLHRSRQAVRSRCRHP